MTDHELCKLIDSFYHKPIPFCLYDHIPELIEHGDGVEYKGKKVQHGWWQDILPEIIDDELREKLIKVAIVHI
jgi:hypothetical protein